MLTSTPFPLALSSILPDSLTSLPGVILTSLRCSYYSSSPPASFRCTASSGYSHHVAHNGAYESQQRYPCSLYISADCTARSRATPGLYTQRSFFLVRHGGTACSLSPIRYVYLSGHESECRLIGILATVFVLYWPSRRRPRG